MIRPGEPVTLKDLVDYQPGGVVSRTLMNTEGGTITVFAFGKDQGLSEHTAPFDALVTVLEGSADILLSGRPHRVRCGETLLMPSGEPHALKAPEAFKMVLIMLRHRLP